MEPTIRAVIFDFDYTLADSSRGVVACINAALAELGLPTVSPEVACRTIGLSLAGTFTHLTGNPSGPLNEAFVRLFIQRADQIMADATVLYPAVPDTVRALRARGLALGIVSTKFSYRITSVLSREGLLDPFSVIVGGKDVANHKPDPEGLRLALERLGCAPDEVLYLGDSLVDAETAQRAGAPFVAVLSGVTPREAFVGYPVRAFLAGVGELPGWLEGRGQSS